MVTCCIHNCSNRSGRDEVQFFKIPTVHAGCPTTIEVTRNRRRLWISRINRKDINENTVTSSTRVCSCHFVKGKPSYHMDVTDPDWAPSQNLGYKLSKEPSASRHDRSKRRALANIHQNQQIATSQENEILNSTITHNNIKENELQLAAHSVAQRNEILDLNSTHNNVLENELQLVTHSDTQREEILNSHSSHNDMQENELQLATHNDTQRNEISSPPSAGHADVNDGHNGLTSTASQTDISSSKTDYPKFSLEHLSIGKKCRFYTGVENVKILTVLYDLVSPHIKKIYRNSSITKFQEFAAVLVRLRLGLFEEDLADRLGVSQGTVSKFFNLWLPVMAECFRGFIIWPDRETLRKTTPECFLQSFGRSVAVVIDCFEVHVATPSGLLAKSQMYSSYKHGTTVKFLIGITPQGTISYISRSWGGRTSDKFITEHCKDFLDKLLPGDVVLADRGFNVGEVIGELMARLVTPSYMHQRLQLPSDEVEMSRRISNVRIHVERLIGLVRRKFSFLEQKLNFSYVGCSKNSDRARIDDAVVVCCALCNLCDPIVPMSENPEDD